MSEPTIDLGGRNATTGSEKFSRITGPWVNVVRAIWVLSVILMLVPTVAGGLVRYPFLLDIGYSPAQATARVSLAILYLIVFGVTGIIIYIRRQDDWVAMLVSLMLFAIATSATDFPDTLVDVNNVIMETDAGIAVTSPSLFIPADLIRSMGLGLPFVVLMVFPSGLAVPRWVRWPLLAHVLWIFARPFLFWLEPIHPIYWSGAVETIWLLGWTALALGSQTYRFTNVASPTQRQQTKWALYGAAIGAIGFVFIRLATTILLPVIASGYDPASPAASLIEYIIYVAIGLPIPITLAISIFRFRLWDVDFLINRSLVYGALTVLLVVLFGGVLLGLTRLLSTMSSAQQSLLAVAIAAAVFGVLFAPTRRALQRLVDRRLYGIEIDYQKPAEPLRDQKVVLPPRDPTSLGDYGRLEMIGSGGMADVYRGRHPSLDSDVAIKVLSVKHLTSDDTRRRFQREAQVIAGLKHPNIVHVYDYGESDHTLYMVMEYIAGPTLSRMLDEKERFTLEEALPILRDVAGALDYAHQQHLVHRDVKPSNVMVELPQTPGRAEARAVLMDFGIARVMDRTSQLTTTGVVGTFSYMAPEQIQAAKDIDGRADVYALGIVAYEMLTGELPFKSNNPGAVLIAHLQQPPPNAANVNATIPRGVGYAIIRAMAKKPADRFPTAGEFVTALEQAALKVSAA